MVKKVARILPSSMKEIGEALGAIHCKGIAHQYREDEMASYIFNFNDEAYGVSMTPSGLIGESSRYVAPNPVKQHYFDISSKSLGQNGFIDHLDIPEAEKNELKRQLRAGISNIVNMILENKYNVNIKSKNGQPSDLQHKSNESLEEATKIMKAQYLQMLYTITMIKTVDKIFTEEKIDIEKVLDGIFGTNWKKKPSLINPRSEREKFFKAVYEKTEKSAPVKKSSKISQNPVDDFYFSHDEGLYFNKTKIDDFIQMNLSSTVDLRPKKSYLKIKALNPSEVESSDMSIPAVFGSKIDNEGQVDYFLITGEGQIRKAISKGLPVVDSIILSPEETLEMVIISTKTKEKIKKMKNSLNQYI